MLYLIDGYNFLFRFIDSQKKLEHQRVKLIRSLQREFSLLHLKGMIVFDAKEQERSFSYKSPLVITYSTKGETADQYILEFLEGRETPGECTVITDDRFLRESAQRLGAKTLTLHKFVAFLQKKHSLKTETNPKPVKESTKEFKRLLDLFTQSM